jgi:hypothetical protein
VILLSGVLTVVALVLLIAAGVQREYDYVYAAIAAGVVGAALVALVVYQRRGELTLDEQDEPQIEHEGVLAGVRPAAEGGQAAGTTDQPPAGPADGAVTQQLTRLPATPVGAPPVAVHEASVHPAPEVEGHVDRSLEDDLLDGEVDEDEPLEDDERRSRPSGTSSRLTRAADSTPGSRAGSAARPPRPGAHRRPPPGGRSRGRGARGRGARGRGPTRRRWLTRPRATARTTRTTRTWRTAARPRRGRPTPRLPTLRRERRGRLEHR